MPGLILPSQWTSQPQVAVGVNWGNPLTRGLAFLSQRDQIFTPFGPIAATKGSSFALAAGRGGVGPAFTNGAGDSLVSTNTFFFGASEPFTIEVLCVATSAPQLSGFGGITRSYASRSLASLGSGSNKNIYFLGGSNLDSGVAWRIDGSLQHVFCTSDGSTMRFYRDGVEIASGTAPTLVDEPVGSFTVGANNFNVGANNHFFKVGFYRRALGPTEVAQLSANPWQIFAPVPRRLWVSVAAGGATYNSSITEALTLADTATVAAILAVAGSGAAALADSPTSATLYASAGAEALTLADSPGAAKILTAAGSEAITAADVITAALVASVTASEAATLADAPSAAAIRAASVAEALTLADAPTAGAVYASSITDGLTLADLGSLGIIVSITEAMSLGDAATATLIAAASVSEALALADTGSNVAIRTATALESLALTDSIAAAGIFASTVVDAMALADLATASGGAGPVIVNARARTTGSITETHVRPTAASPRRPDDTSSRRPSRRS